MCVIRLAGRPKRGEFVGDPQRESVKWYSAAGRPPLRPDCAMVPVWVITPRRASTRCRFVAST